MFKIPEILDRCVEKLKKQGKSESSAFAICTDTLKKAGKLSEEAFESKLEDIAEVEEGTEDFEELETYLQENALLAWSAPTKRKDVPASHFFDPKNKRYPYRNPDGSVNCDGVMAAWKMAHGARSGQKASSSLISKIKPYRDKCMKGKDSKKQQDLPYVKFSSNLPEFPQESIELAEKKKPVKIQVLRRGKFRHPWYGVLNFDDTFFDNVIKNFEAGVPQAEIAFDFRHNPDWGAAAWISKLSKSDAGLTATVDLTTKGRQSVKDREFRFFSIEYTDDYVEYRFSQEPDETTGEMKDVESKVSHGPTVLGGGLTNRPFIKGMLPVSLSEDGEVFQFEEVDDNPNNKNNSEEVNTRMEKTLKELQKEQKELKDKVKELSEKDDKDSKKALEDVTARLDEIEAKITELSDDGKSKKKSEKEKKKEDQENVNLEEYEKTKKELEDKNKELNERDTKIKELSDNVSSLSNSVKKLMESNKVLQHDKHVANIEVKLEGFRKKGAHPSTIEVMENALLSEEANGFSITLSDDKGNDVTKTLADIFEEIIDSIPEENRVDLSEKSETTIDTGNKELSVEEVEKYAKENEITFDDALVHFSKEGKIT